MGKRKVDKSDHSNGNEEICRMLMELAEYERNMNREIYKYNAYRKAATTLMKYPKRIKSGEETRQLEGIGVKIGDKIDEFLKSGHLEKLDKIRADDANVAITALMSVSGIGPVQAKKLVEEGIKTVEDLKKHENKLTHHQKIGLKYYDEFRQCIPRTEIEQLNRAIEGIVKGLDERFMITVCGSYRRGLPDSGDIDILLTHTDYVSPLDNKEKSHTLLSKVVDELKKRMFVTDIISQGEVKFMGVCQLQNDNEKTVHLHRRIDIRIIPKSEYWCCVLYFTGSDEFNRNMRQKANQTGFTINEYCIRRVGSTGKPGEMLHVESERDLFDYIGMEFVEPKDRNL